jgi:hypothetical protein
VDLAHSKVKTDYCFHIDPSRWNGVSFAEAKAKATGFFGHVGTDTVNDHPAYKIEYWQYWAYNDQNMVVLGNDQLGDHESDITGLLLWFDRTLHKIVKVEYLIHGRPLDFNIPDGDPPSCKDCFITVEGSQHDTGANHLGNYFDSKSKPNYSDNQAEFYIDPNGDRHTVVYIERGAHE